MSSLGNVCSDTLHFLDNKQWQHSILILIVQTMTLLSDVAVRCWKEVINGQKSLTCKACVVPSTAISTCYPMSDRMRRNVLRRTAIVAPPWQALSLYLTRINQTVKSFLFWRLCSAWLFCLSNRFVRVLQTFMENEIKIILMQSFWNLCMHKFFKAKDLYSLKRNQSICFLEKIIWKWTRENKKERERCRFSIFWFTSEMVKAASPGQSEARSQELLWGLSNRHRDLVLATLHSQAHDQRVVWAVEQPGIKWKPTCDVWSTGGGYTSTMTQCQPS